MPIERCFIPVPFLISKHYRLFAFSPIQGNEGVIQLDSYFAVDNECTAGNK